MPTANKVIIAAVFADTHANIGKACKAIQENNPDLIIHLGDHDRDAVQIHELFPEIPLYSVRGNCDSVPVAPDEEVVPIGPVKAFITHGHLYNVDWSVDSLVYAAMEKDCKIAMYGHTHCADYREIGGVTVLNPGTAGRGRTLSWAKVTVFDNGGFACEIKEF